MTNKKKCATYLNATNISIIDFILKNREPVAEPEIREHLKKTDKSISQATVNRHLHELWKEFACIESCEPIKKSRSNYWNVTKINHLKNIKYYCPKLPLKTYEKSFYIILQEFGEEEITLRSLNIYAHLLSSASLFDDCISSGVKTLLERSWKVYQSDKGFKNDWKIKKLLNSFYELCIRRNVNIEMSIEELMEMLKEQATKIDEVSEERFLRMFKERLPFFTIEVSIEAFLKIEEEVKNNFNDDSVYSNVWKECFDERIEEKFPGYIDKELYGVTELEFERELDFISKEISTEIVKDKIQKNILNEMFQRWSKKNEISSETYRDKFDKDISIFKILTEIFSIMKEQQKSFKISCFNSLLKHFFEHDLLTGVVSPEEFEFQMKTKVINEINLELMTAGDYNGSAIISLFGALKPTSKIIYKYKQPTIFYADTSEEVLQKLTDFFCPGISSDLLEAYFKRI